VLETLFRRRSKQGLWLDAPGAMARRTGDGKFARHLRELAEQGWTRLERNVAPSLCDEVFDEFRHHCERYRDEATQFRDSNGLHSRLTNFHMVSGAALKIGLDPNLLALMDAVFDQKAAICSSLTFEKGSQQAVHRDSPFFHTEPPGRFLGVWTALEDVHPDAAPLIYYSGGHRLAVDRLRFAWAQPNGDRDVMFREYQAHVERECVTAGLTLRSTEMRKGDTFVWHPELPHGGASIRDPRRTRKSIVFHYLPEDTPIGGLEFFFSSEKQRTRPAFLIAQDRSYIDHGQPRFAPNY
jgi:phytanoyl-CoA hydroxylase